MRCARVLATGLLLVLLGVQASAQQPVPAPSSQSDALIRFWVEGYRDPRGRSIRELQETLKQQGFQEDPEAPLDPFDPRATGIHGTIPNANARQLLDQRFVRTIRIRPTDVAMPEKGKFVRVAIDLMPGLAPEQQRILANQVRQVIRPLGFQESVGYENRGNTRLVGLIPSEAVDILASDLQRNPLAWPLLGHRFFGDMLYNPAGQEILRQILDTLYDHPVGKEIVRKGLNDWSAGPEASRLLSSLPPEVARAQTPANRIKQEVFLLAQLSQDPEAVNVLSQILADIQASKINYELMELVFKPIFLQMNAVRLPLFYRVISPIRFVEAFPGVPAPTPRLPGEAIPREMEKLSPDMREFVALKSDSRKPYRFEVLLQRDPNAVYGCTACGQPPVAPADRAWLDRFYNLIPDITVEGVLGSILTVNAPLSAISLLVEMPEVVGIRLPRLAHTVVQTDPGRLITNLAPLTRNGAEKLMGMGQQKGASRVAVISSSFQGWESLVGKDLPANTHYLDLTAEHNRNLLPDPEMLPARTFGQGVPYAVQVSKAIPSADLTLIRVDPASPYQILTVARLINGDRLKSLNIDRRQVLLDGEGRLLELRREKLREERDTVLNNFDADDATVARRQDFFRRQAELDREQADYDARLTRYFKLIQGMQELKGIKVVANSLVWPEGHPLDGGSPLSRYFDDTPFKKALWFQAAGDTQAQAWSGLFRDSDQNSVMEFIPPDARLPRGALSRELNSLGWQARGSEQMFRDLPANAVVRLSLQWAEAHDPTLYLNNNNPYARPIGEFRIVLLYQPDPTGLKQPADDFRLVAQSEGLPLMLEQRASVATYEQSIQVRLPQAGRYLVRIEGRAPTSTRPGYAPTIPVARRVGEVHPRLFVETIEGPGQAGLMDYVTPSAGIGVPGDALRVLSLGSPSMGPQGSFTAPNCFGTTCKPNVTATNPNQP